MPLRATATAAEPDLLFLPWGTALEQWPAEDTVAMPRGISRHTVRFVRINGAVFAVKEIEESFAQREYELLFDLRRLGAPCVEPVGVIAGRVDADGEDLPAALITRHLSFSLPYRALVKPTLSVDTWERLLDALVLLIVRLHLLGFAWNDCSLSNTLFLRDAGAFSAHLVDAETGEMHETLSRGQRAYDIETASMNVMGELMDLQAGGMVPETLDPARGRPGLPAPVRAPVDDPHRRRDRVDLGPLPDPHAAADTQRPGLRRRRALRGLGRWWIEHPCPAQGRRRRAPPPTDAAPDRPGDAREPGPAAAQRHRLLPVRGWARPRRERRSPPLGHRRVRRRAATDPRRTCAASSRARSWSTRSLPTDGSPRSARARTWASRPPPTTTSQRSCAASPTRQPSSARPSTTRMPPTTWMPRRCERPPRGQQITPRART